MTSSYTGCCFCLVSAEGVVVGLGILLGMGGWIMWVLICSHYIVVVVVVVVGCP